MSNTTRYELRILNGSPEANAALLTALTRNGRIHVDSLIPTPEALIFDDADITPELKALVDKKEPSLDLYFTALSNIKDKDHRVKARHYVDRLLRDNPRDYGDVDVDEWRYQHWGFYAEPLLSNSDDPATLCFEAAYVMRADVWEALSAKHPDTTFELRYANERLGLNCGIMHLSKGAVTHVEKSQGYMDDHITDDPKFNQLAAEIYYPKVAREDLESFDEHWRSR